MEELCMKYLYRLAVVLIGLGFAVSIVFLALAPDVVPAHYDSAGEADRMGSKYEYVLFPFISAGMGAVFLLLAKQAGIKKWGDGTWVEKIFLFTAIGEILLFHGIGGAAMWAALHYVG